MRALGLNLGTTRTGKELRDGGVCIIEDGEIAIAIAEERVCRKKYAGGFSHALDYCLAATDLQMDNFDAIVVSSCCEDADKREVVGLCAREDTKTHFIESHHLSHAYSAFCVSPFDRALIIVMDGGGNVIGKQKHLDWWKNPREQNTYYIGEGTHIRLIGRDFAEPYEVGFGEAYRCFTYYLGWPSSTYAGNTMALAACGNPERFANLELFKFEDGRLRCRLANDPLNPIGMIYRFADDVGTSLGKHRKLEEEIRQQHKDLACFIQSQLEKALIAKVKYLCHQTGITDICIAGGVGLNCVANTRILEETPVQNLFVQPAAGDQGQSLGNALYGYHCLLGKPRKSVMTHTYWGRDYSRELHDLDLDLSESSEFECIRSANIAQDTARLIAKGYIVGWFQGRSELGPRALGNRSILAHPGKVESKNRLDTRVKQREGFRPYAPSVLEDHAQQCFDYRQESPFMLLVATVKPAWRGRIRAVVHVDNTARLHTVSRNENPEFYRLIEEFRKLTDIPLVLNTSFNGRGAPIVETPEDAIRCFKEHDIDVLAIGDYLIERCRSRAVSISGEDKLMKEYDVWVMTAAQLQTQIRIDFRSFALRLRSKFRLIPEYIRWLQEGTKCTTVRYRPDAIDAPAALELPLLESADYENNNNLHDPNNQCVGTVQIKHIAIKPFAMLDDQDAQRDGFPTESKLKEALQRLYTPIYGSIRDDEYVTIYTIALVGGEKPLPSAFARVNR